MSIKVITNLCYSINIILSHLHSAGISRKRKGRSKPKSYLAALNREQTVHHMCSCGAMVKDC